jgi:hypothetical protein
MYSKLETGNFTTLVYSILLNVNRNELKMAETLWENSHIIAKDIRIVHVNFIGIIITLPGKTEALLLYHPS